MPAIKSTSASADKWVRRAGQASGDYANGVKSPKKDWATATAEAADAQEAGVQAALANKSFEKGVAAAGSGKWAKNAAGKGSQRFGPGVAAAKADYETGFAPFAQVISGITLPPRGPKGDPRNFERSKIIGDALHAAKTGA